MENEKLYLHKRVGGAIQTPCPLQPASPAPNTQTQGEEISPALPPSPSIGHMGSSRQRCSQERRNGVWVSA